MRNHIWLLMVFAVAVLKAQEISEDNGIDSSLTSEFSNARKTRAIDSKLAVESESPSSRDSLLLREPRDVNDKDDNETTTSLPLENDDSTPNSAQNNTMEEEVDSNSMTSDDTEKDTGTSRDSTVAPDEGVKVEQASSSEEEAVTVPQETSEQQEDVQGRSRSDIEALELAEPSSSPASEEEASAPTSSPTSEEQTQSLTSVSDVNNDLETTTLIVYVDSSSDDASAEKTSTEITENEPSDETTDENEDNFLNSGSSENEDIEEVTEEEEEDDGPTDATFEEATGSSADGESTEETVPVVPESSSTVAPSRKYSFILYDESNIPCILASMSITLRATYTTKDKKTRTKSLQVPSTASVSGFCGDKESNMTLSWPVPGTSFEREDMITFTLKRDDSNFYVSSIQVNLVPNNENFPNVIDDSLRGNSATDLRLFSASLKSGAHVCRPMTEVTCGQIVVLIKDVSLIAYNNVGNVSDREEEQCSLPAKSVSLAAIVGGIVGVTVTIGIVASYAWYRKRTSTFRSELP